MGNKPISPIGRTWEEARAELFTPEEIAASDIRVALMGDIIQASQRRVISQKKPEEISGAKQSPARTIQRRVPLA